MGDYQRFYDEVNAHIGFPNHNHLVITQVADNYAQGILDIVPESLSPEGMVHPGCLTTLADAVTGIAANTTTGANEVCVTVNCTMNFLRATRGGRITCTSSVQKVGRTLCIFDATLTDNHGHVVATGCFTFYKAPKLVVAQP